MERAAQWAGGRADSLALMKVMLMLCDSAQVADGKLYILGGGWSITDLPSRQEVMPKNTKTAALK